MDRQLPGIPQAHEVRTAQWELVRCAHAAVRQEWAGKVGSRDTFMGL